MTIKFLGQNCFLLMHQGKNILTDPFYNFQKEASGFDISAQKIDAVLITHAHIDHTADVKEVLAHHPEAVVIAQPEVCGYFGHQHSIDLNLGGSTQIGEVQMTMVQASHTSSFDDGSYGGVPSGYIILYDGKKLYFAGDTAVIPEMELFPRLFGKIDWAILPIGGHYTMDSKMASFAAAELLKTSKVVGCHFDTFPPISINHSEAHEHFSTRNIELVLPKVGEEIAG